jgi:hypothetical protein
MSKEKRNQTYSGELDVSDNITISEQIEKEVTIMFRENRKFDLHIGRNVKTFYGRETKRIPASWLEHEDWQNVKKYFVVKGV